MAFVEFTREVHTVLLGNMDLGTVGNGLYLRDGNKLEQSVAIEMQSERTENVTCSSCLPSAICHRAL